MEIGYARVSTQDQHPAFQRMGVPAWRMWHRLERATALQPVLFSQDGDLLAIARERQTTGVFFAGLIYGHQLAATTGKYVLDLEMICQVLNPADMANRIEYLPLR